MHQEPGKIEPHTHDEWRIRQMAAIVESTDDAVIGTTLDGVITNWNGGAERLFGYDAEEAIGSSIAIIVPPDLEDEREAMISVVKRGERMSHIETRRRRKDGHDVDVSLAISPITDVHDRILGASCIARDISERKHAEAEADRLKSEFFALVSHELRTPLTSIVGYIELLTDHEQEQLPAQAREFLEVVHRNAERLDELVQDVLLVAQVEAGTFGIEPGTIDIAEMMAQCEADVRLTAERAGIELACEIGEVPLFAGDPKRFHQVMQNLVSNAIKFTPPGGRVHVRIAAENDSCVIEIADTGIGIEPEALAKLFDRFYRSRSADSQHVQGAGLGLAITKAIVDAHGGTIDVTSEVGKGSTFRIVLPMRPCEKKSSERRWARRRPGAPGKRQVAEVRR